MTNKIPYKRESNIFTVNGPLMEFNGVWKPFLSPIDAKAFSINNPLHGIVRIGGKDDKPYRYFLNGKEYKADELFLD